MKSEFEIWIQLKNTLKRLGPISHENTTYFEIELDSLKAHHFPMGKERQAMSKYHKLIFPPQGKTTGQTSNQSQGQSIGKPIPQYFEPRGKSNI